jgi:hypothetical protein
MEPSFLGQKGEDRQDRQLFYMTILTIFRWRSRAGVVALGEAEAAVAVRPDPRNGGAF